MILLDTGKPNNIRDIFIEHGIKTAYAFTGTFATILFGSIFMTSKRRTVKIDVIDLVVKNLNIVVIIALIATVIFNIYTYLNNSSINNIVKITFDESSGTFTIGVTNYYSNKITEVIVAAASLSLKRINNDQHQTIQLFNNKRVLGYIDLDTKFEITNRKKLDEITAFINMKNLNRNII